ncbi:ATP synthase I [Staphylococcus schleiferi]|uniref:ATP synthase subunit I n=1 Tax=Staphylococcus coagulans TaxID=74706 RepID=A0ABU1EY03_9STAP|nr:MULTISPECIES: ATP synthase subunit I [Staphylococcus]NHA36667.1 hypothetical protein [Staphylococcus schleiferi]MBA8760626.1 hypothetical protein [Staphylococcus coagulans]MBA8762840.1 hypothetical protein [Staphylococcus coagulans]MBA8769355.1 hypothetical protein [Staphylococcus coagulans]MBT2831029.1 hypothetical protein [Staphylococcus coagulans]
MNRFSKMFQPFLTYYSTILVGLLILYVFKIQPPIVLGLIVGIIASFANTCIFEYYLERSKKTNVGHISTGSGWRFLIAILACTGWVFFQAQIHILGVLIGLMVSYVLMVFRPFIKSEKDEL